MKMTKRERLNKLFEEGQTFLNRHLTPENNKFIGWKNSLLRFIEQYYGKDSTILKQFRSVSFYPCAVPLDAEDDIDEEYFNDGMEEILEDLRRLIDELDDIDETSLKTKSNNSTSNNSPYISLNVDASNKNTISNINANTISIKSYKEVREDIENNTYLDDKSKKELLEKLNEIEALESSKENKSKKWDVGKKILGFILDKGADVAISYIPLIIQAISK